MNSRFAGLGAAVLPGDPRDETPQNLQIPSKHLNAVQTKRTRLASPGLGLLAIILATLFSVSATFAQSVSFSSATNLAAGTGPRFVATGDLNGDGKLDLVVTNYLSNDVSILLGTGTGSFGAATSFPTGNGAFAVAIGDLNGDGKPDLAVANIFNANVSILLGTGTGSFGLATNLAVGTYPMEVAIGDLNGDGKPDLAVANHVSSNVSILLGDGTGAFGPATNIAAGTNPRAVAIGDINGDGDLDLAVANFVSNNVSILLGDGTGSFGAASNFAAGTGPVSVAIGDLNGDGKRDLAVANFGGNDVSILLGDGTGAFGLAANFGAGAVPSSMGIVDFNGDGKPDLAVANNGSNNISILTGDGTGAFGSATNFAVGTGPRSAAIGDLNGDGKPDLTAANPDSSNVSILLNTTLFDPSGSFDPATNFTAGVGPESVAIGDLNGDGKPDLALADFLGSSVSILLGDGTGNFGVTTNFVAGWAPISVAIGDLNGDGKLDLAVANLGSNSVSILLGDGTGSFGLATDFGVGTNPYSVAIGDLNGDGYPDLALANISSDNVSVLFGTGTGAFSAATNFAAGTNPLQVEIGDLNGDGKSDLAVANYGSNNVSILLGNGAGAFGAALSFTVGTPPTSIAIGDLNSDGHSDLSVSNQFNDYVSILLGDGAGGFGAATNFAAGTSPRSAAIGDLNRDGKPDLASANFHSNEVSILFGDGAGAFGAAANFAAGTSPRYAAIGDLNGDGKPDLAVANPDSNNVSILLNTDPNNQPVAAFTAVPNPSACGQVLRFDASTSSHGRPDRAIVSYAWDFGDGATGSGVNVFHAYGAFGNYNVVLTVTDNNSPAKTDTETIVVSVSAGNQSPLANSGGPYTIIQGTTLNLNGSASIEPDASCGDRINSYAWDLDNDGQFDDASGAFAAVPWSTLSSLGLGVGQHTIRLQVTDTLGAASSSLTTLTVNVAPPAPTLNPLSPGKAAQGTAVAVAFAGTNFVPGYTTVSINTPDVTISNVNFTSSTAGTATFNVAANALLGDWQVTVTTPGGTSNIRYFSVYGIPTIATISPNNGSRGTSFTVTLTGSQFLFANIAISGTGVTTSNKINNGNYTVQTNTFTIASTATPGPRTVTLSNAAGTSNPVTFTVNSTPPAPTLNPLSPSRGQQGTSVAVTFAGINFVPGNTTVGINTPGVTISNVNFTSGTAGTATFNVAANALLGDWQVTVTTPGGTSNIRYFSVYGIPTVATISPTNGSRGTSFTVTLTGSNFLFANIAISGTGITTSNKTTSSNYTVQTYKFTIASTATPGPRTVTLSNAAGTSNPVTFTVN